MPVSAATSTTRNTSHAPGGSTPLLREGSRGPAVSRLQSLLRARGFSVEADGRFGRKTEQAVRAFQSRSGLVADGEVGRKTWEALSTRQGGNAGSGNVGVGGTPSAFDQPAATGRIAAGYQNGRRVSVALSEVGGGCYLNTRAAPSYRAMMAAARRDGVNLSLLSAFRSMEQQQHLYNLYRSGRGNKAARPGYSNHQMGLSVDLGNTGGYGGRNYRWLKQNAARFGFYNDVRGEPWHWTYKR